MVPISIRITTLLNKSQLHLNLKKKQAKIPGLKNVLVWARHLFESALNVYWSNRMLIHSYT